MKRELEFYWLKKNTIARLLYHTYRLTTVTMNVNGSKKLKVTRSYRQPFYLWLLGTLLKTYLNLN
jgi:hypothetical protein